MSSSVTNNKSPKEAAALNKVNALVLEREIFLCLLGQSGAWPGATWRLYCSHKRKGLTEDKGYNLETVQSKSRF
jgi:hypothetical protein